jgi:hypothetical protein
VKEHEKRGLVTLLAGLGVITLLLGAFNFIEFRYGFMSAFIIWVLAGSVANFMKVEKAKRR